MSREAYNSLPNIGTRASPGNRARRLTELPTVDKSPSRDFQRGSPLGNKFKQFIWISSLKIFWKKKYFSQKHLNCHLLHKNVYTFICLMRFLYTQTQLHMYMYSHKCFISVIIFFLSCTHGCSLLIFDSYCLLSITKSSSNNRKN